MKSFALRSRLVAASVFAFLVSALPLFATTAWHLADNAEIDANGGVGSQNIVHMRDPWIEISNNPASPTTITIYQGIQKWMNSGATQIANQTGGTLYYKGLSQGTWTGVPLGFHQNLQSQNNQYWKASFVPATIAANDPIQYYIFVATDGSNGNSSGFLFAPAGMGDHQSAFVNGSDTTGDPGKATATANPFTIRNRPGWIFHANNRVNSGSDVQFWVKVGYIGNPDLLATRWADNGALYYTTDNTDPVPGTSPGSAGNASTHVATFTYDHPENSNQNGGTQSIAGTAMWWVATGPGLLSTPLGTVVKYKVGFWNSANNEQKFGDYNAGDGSNNLGHVFSFNNGTVGDPVLTVASFGNGTLSANYTTSHVFIDETRGDSIPFALVFSPGQANVTAVEIFTNLNRRDKAALPYTDVNGIATEEGIEPLDGNNLVAGDDTHYYKAYTMPADGNPGEYALTLPATKTGAYRLTARWKVQGDNTWRYFTNIPAGRRDHAVVVSPVAARSINLYEANVFNLDGSGTGFANRGTLEDMFDANNAPHQGAQNHWNLTYLKNLGCNWLWFQPIHPITQEAQLGHDPGSPYSVRSFFDINPLMTVNYNASLPDPVNNPANRTAALQAFQGLVSAATAAGVSIMLDAPFNHSAPDCEVSVQGTSLFGSNPSSSALFRDVDTRFYSRPSNYAMRASISSGSAVAPDRGDFGKWSDVRDVFFGRYAALVDINPDDNGFYLNEQDWFDYSIGSENSFGTNNGHFDQVTQNVWKYFSNYTLYWLSQTGVPQGSNLATQTANGIGALRADFGQGLPPQLWEYIINKTRTRKWNFVFMAESLDGGAVTYRSNRHFDLLNENIVFPLKNASSTSDFRSIFDGRRNAYGQSLVLLNNMSHDEEAYADPWFGVIRYAVCSTIDGAPLIFPGQELGISTTVGYNLYETNFGKNIADFKDFNSMTPAWTGTDFGNQQLYPVYSGMGQARLFSTALRSSNRYYLNQTGGGAVQPSIFSVAKYDTPNGSPATNDVVFAFANLDRNGTPSGNFDVNITQSGSNLFGIKSGRQYNVKNIAAYTAIRSNRRDIFQWRTNPADEGSAPAPRTGSDILSSGIFVAMNKVPTTNGAWSTAPYEAQYLKVYDVTAPSGTPGTPTPPNAYSYSVSNSVTVSWAAAPPDSEGVVPCYKVSVTINGNTTSSIVCGTSTVINGTAGQTVTVTVQAVNPSDNSVTGASSTTNIRFIAPNGDDDGDGMTNVQEDIAGTNPFNPTSICRITNVTSTTVTWPTVQGRTYQLFKSSSPAFGTSTAVGPSYTETAAAGTHAQSVSDSAPVFYRVQVSH